MAKEIKKIIKITIPAGGATMAPPIGPTLAPYGINAQDFCAQFNEKTRENNGKSWFCQTKSREGWQTF